MSDLVAFLTARLDEDEAAAKAAPGSEWQAFTEDDVAGASVYDEQWLLLYPQRYSHDNKLSNKRGATGPRYIECTRDELAAHIARHDPARVLREVEAKRRILAAELDCETFHGNCHQRDPEHPAHCPTLAALAGAYAGHPDYEEAWK